MEVHDRNSPRNANLMQLKGRNEENQLLLGSLAERDHRSEWSDPLSDTIIKLSEFCLVHRNTLYFRRSR